jgi:isocitrate/isopropylmalate dehydrogenase
MAFMPGDGVGPEIFEQISSILDLLNKKLNLKIEYTNLPYSSEYYLNNNIVIPDDRLEKLKKEYHTILIGPLGDPRIPDAINTRQLIYKLRQYYDLSTAIQHVQYYNDNILPLKEIPKDDFDFYIFRENIEGFNNHFTKKCGDGDYLNISDESTIYTRKNLEEFFSSCFQYADSLDRRKITLVLKKYYFPKTNKLWSNVFNQISEKYSGIETRIISTEIAEYYILNNPAQFDILLAPDIFADQLMTLGVFLMGGFGMCFYYDYGPKSAPVFRILHRPSHKYKNSDQANPIGTVRALSHIFKHFNMQKPEAILNKSLRSLFNSNKAPIDMGGLLGTQETVDYILNYIEKI